jgi:REP element-mobilizing transposase RayT
VPGTTYLISRRCFERRFLLRPDRFVVHVFLYCLAYAAQTHGILVHGFVTLSNHLHLCVTDPDGRLPCFMEHLDGLLARAINAFRGRWERFFAPGSYSAVGLASPDDIVEKLVYLLTNPVTAGLVSHSRRWLGATSQGWVFGETRRFERPVGPFFDPHGRMPASVELLLSAPPGFEDVPAEQFLEDLRHRIIERETEIRARFRLEGRAPLGMDGVMRIDPND